MASNVICLLAGTLFGVVIGTIINSIFFIQLREIIEENRKDKDSSSDNNESNTIEENNNEKAEDVKGE